MIHLISKNINGLFVLSFKNGNNDPTRDIFISIAYHLSKSKILIYQSTTCQNVKKR